ncbi:hypothetical protein F4680DRAFT_424212 [Xylaria scruposa]|nr:hypothetical protein F4680DRAFT_424212 [Xylaria scruposa]
MEGRTEGFGLLIQLLSALLQSSFKSDARSRCHVKGLLEHTLHSARCRSFDSNYLKEQPCFPFPQKCICAMQG